MAKDVLLSNKMNNTDDILDISQVSKEYVKFVADTVKEYQSTNLTKALESHNEIMVGCQSYYAVRYAQWHILVHEFLKAFGTKIPSTDEITEFIK